MSLTRAACLILISLRNRNRDAKKTRCRALRRSVITVSREFRRNEQGTANFGANFCSFPGVVAPTASCGRVIGILIIPRSNPNDFFATNGLSATDKLLATDGLSATNRFLATHEYSDVARPSISFLFSQVHEPGS